MHTIKKSKIAVLAGILGGAVIVATLTIGLSPLPLSQSESEAIKPLNVNVLVKDSASLAPGEMTTLPLTLVVGSDETSIITLDSAIVTNNGTPYEIAEGFSSIEGNATLEAGDSRTVLLTIRADPTVKEGTYYLKLEASNEEGLSSAWYFPVEVTTAQ